MIKGFDSVIGGHMALKLVVTIGNNSGCSL